jgi:hypothetical protein
MIAMLTVMSDIDLSHDYWGTADLGLVKCWVWMVFATGVRSVSSVWFWLQG